MNRKSITILSCLGVAVALLFAIATPAGAVRPVLAKNTANTASVAVKLATASATPVFVPLSKNTYVYITKTGKKYHKSGCRYLKKSKIKKTLKWAKAHGYKRCSVCKPPK